MTNYDRILQLKQKVESGTASDQEREEYINFLYNQGSISDEQYNQYKKNKNSEEVWKVIRTVGGIILAGILLRQLLKKD